MMKNSFPKYLINWYFQQKIDLPWRLEQKNLYKTWISEIMLQQSQVKTVIPFFINWMKKFPTIESVSTSSIDKILKAWEGLGYYRRAHFIKHASQIICDKHNGQIPKTYNSLIQLPGVGDYTASAILSIGYNLPFFAIDGNFIRVFSRFFEINNSNQKTVETIKKKLKKYKISNYENFNQAVMDLGRTICKPKPKCLSCPIIKMCSSNKNSTVHLYPLKTIKKTKPNYKIVVGIVYKLNRFIVTKRAAEALLGGLWELPGGKMKNKESEKQALHRELKEELNIEINILKKLSFVTHEYSHFKVKIFPYICEYKSGPIKLNGATDWQWIEIQNIRTKTFPSATHKIFELIKS